MMRPSDDALSTLERGTGSECEEAEKQKASSAASVCSGAPLFARRKCAGNSASLWLYIGAGVLVALLLCLLCALAIMMSRDGAGHTPQQQWRHGQSARGDGHPPTGVQFMSAGAYRSRLETVHRLHDAGYDLHTWDGYSGPAPEALRRYASDSLPADVVSYAHGVLLYDRPTQLCVYYGALETDAPWHKRAHQIVFLLQFGVHAAAVEPHTFYVLPHQTGGAPVLLPPPEADDKDAEPDTSAPPPQRAVINHGGPNIVMAGEETATGDHGDGRAVISHGGANVLVDEGGDYELPEGAVRLDADEVAMLTGEQHNSGSDRDMENTRLSVFPDGGVGAVYLGDNNAAKVRGSEQTFSDHISTSE